MDTAVTVPNDDGGGGEGASAREDLDNDTRPPDTATTGATDTNGVKNGREERSRGGRGGGGRGGGGDEDGDGDGRYSAKAHGLEIENDVRKRVLDLVGRLLTAPAFRFIEQQ